MNGGDLAGWDSFFLALVGAAAALAGLIFVAVSINLPRILEYNLTHRAAEALVALVSVVLVTSLGLVPGQSLRAFGAEVLAIGAVSWAIQLRSLRRTLRNVDRPTRYVHALTNQGPPVPFIVAGGLLLGGVAGGLYWVVAGVLLSIVAAILDAWVLLVEIQR